MLNPTPMNIAVDVGNTCLKCGLFFPNGGCETQSMHNPLGIPLDVDVLLPESLLRWESLSETEMLTTDVYPEPLTWWIALTGTFSWQELQKGIAKIRPQDQFVTLTRQQIPLKVDVDSPEKVGIDRLLAAFAATEKYGDVPMLIVDAGSAITVDAVYDRTFCGGAILPGLVAASKALPQISKKLPLVPIAEYSESGERKPPIYPGRNTEDAIENGLYWGAVGTIRQLHDIVFAKTLELLLVMTGGDAEYLLPGLAAVIPPRKIMHHDTLVLEGINLCAAKSGFP